ncbi:Aste57867_20988 [Aphanomyces stellatus]|uniref:Aste57867_20988 protein n=1 Tax=Aphanomyces stellatus TaxID=120398 RepID=A0A485LGB5_9STRA|nr:hypothetical protein As57867_020920 [Aphanomyces stellatus]VFT97663.1 Aste57867_20988 [Aphanomyces stellatus]
MATLRCKFGSKFVDAMITSNTTIVCYTPDSNNLGNVSVKLVPEYLFRQAPLITFEYMPRPQLQSAFPINGMPGTDVVFTGYTIPYLSTLLCQFDSILVTATYVNDTMVVCTAPVHAAGPVSISVLVDPQNSIPGWNATFTYITPPTIATFSPLQIFENKAVIIDVQGFNFIPNLQCQVNADGQVVQILVAKYVSPTLVQCGLEGVTISNSLSLSIFAQSAIINTQNLTLLPALTPEQWTLNPTLGTMTGGYSVHVMGSNFPMQQLTCWFGDKKTPGYVLSTEMVQCIVPASSTVSMPQLSLQFGGTIFHTLLTFTYLPRPVVTSTSPSMILANTPTLIDIHGHRYDIRSTFQCQFNVSTVAAIVLSTSMLQCEVPLFGEGSVEFQVMVDLIVLWSSSLALVPPPVIVPQSQYFGWQGTHVDLQGYNLKPITHCKFGVNSTVLAELQSSTSVRCPVPINPTTYSNTTITLFVQSSAITFPALSFAYIPPMAIDSVSSGASQTLLVRGQFYGAKNNILCTFGLAGNTTGVVVNTSLLSCPIPSAVDYATVSFVVYWNGIDPVPSVPLTYSYSRPINITKLQPNRGYLQGATTVRVYGIPVVSGTITCLFGSQFSTSSYETTTQSLLCVTPPVYFESDVQFALVVNQTSVPTSLVFSYTRPPVIESIAYTWSSQVVRLNVRLRDPIQLNETVWLQANVGPTCLAQVVNTTSLLCTLSPIQESELDLMVSVNGIDFVSIPYHLTLARQPVQVFQIAPSFGVAPSTEKILVYGDGFDICNQQQNNISCHCKFGNKTAAAVYISTTALSCITPQLIQAANFALVVNDTTVPTDPIQFDIIRSEIPLKSIAPLSGLTRGGSVINVLGEELDQRLGCWFDSKVFVSATILNASLLQCTTPPWRNASIVSIAIVSTLNRQIISPLLVNFSYVVPPIVTQVTPQVIADFSNHAITLTLQQPLFVGDGASWSCQFISSTGNLTSPASWNVENSTISCVTPRMNASVVPLHLILNGVDNVWTGWTLTVIPSNTLASIQPSLVAFDTAVPVVITTLYPLPLHASFDCVFHDTVNGTSHIQSAQMFTSNAVTCTTPTFTQYGDATVSLWMENQIYSSNSLRVQVYARPTGTSLIPSSGPATGNSSVRILGHQYIQSAALMCRFGAMSTNFARYISPAEIQCVVPPSVPGTVNVSVSFNGLYFEPLALMYTYLPAWRIRTVNPNNGPLTGGTLVNVTGVGFNATLGPLACVFGNISVAAQVVTNERVFCTSPPVVSPTVVSVSLVADGQLLLAQMGQAFSFLQVMTIQAAEPISGIELMPMDINIFGMHFARTIQCRFNRTTTGGVVFVSPYQIKCQIQAGMAHNNVELDVSNNGVEFIHVASLAFYPPLVAEVITPMNGPVTGGTAITLSGANMHLAQLCRFDNILMPVHPIRRDAIQCTTPPHAAGPIKVELSGNRHDFTPSDAVFVYQNVPQVLLILPLQGQPDTLLTLQGTSFTAPASCRFNLILVDAQVLSPTKLVCIVPPLVLPVVNGLVQTKVAVEVSLNQGQDFSSNKVQFEYVLPFHIRRVAPVFGPESGGTNVRLVGRGFQQSKLYNCLFDTSVVPAVYISPFELQCTTPLHRPGTVALSLVDELNNMFPTTFTFEFTLTITLLSVAPPVVGTGGGTQIWIHGLQLRYASSMVCYFDSIIVPAVFYNSSMVSCLTPQHHRASIVTLGLSVNGVDMEQSTLTLSFVHAPVIATISKKDGISPVGDNVTLVGRHFAVDTQCWVGGIQTLAKVISDTLMTCTTPPQSLFPQTSLQLFSSGTIGSNVVALAYVLPSIIRYVVPPFGRTNGGTPLRILGQNFNRSLHLNCVFMSLNNATTLYTQATFVSPYELNCLSPTMAAPQPLQLAIFQDNESTTVFGGHYRAVPSLQIYNVTPTSALHRGGKLVSVQGAHFIQSSALRCAFGSLLVPASFINSSLLTCVTPAHAPTSVPFGVSNNNQDIESSEVTFTFQRPLYVNSIQPTHGPTSGNTTVQLGGSGFGPSLTCWFGSIASLAVVLSNTSAACLAPPSPFAWKTTTVSLGVSVDGQDPKVFVDYTYMVLNQVDTIAPSQAFTVGGTTVTVETLRASQNVSCVFASVHVFASTIAPTTFACVSPVAAVGVVNLTIFESNQLIGTVPFGFLPSPFVVHVAPTQVALAGSNDIDIVGLHMDTVTQCLIGSISVTAFVDDTSVHCATPPQSSPGAYPLLLASPFGQIDTMLTIQYVAPAPASPIGENELIRPILLGVTPTTVDSSGGTLLRLRGSNFRNTHLLACQFGSVSVPATFHSSTFVTCIAPRHVPASVVVEVTSDGLTFSLSGSTITVVYDIVVTQLAPTYGTLHGGTLVTIQGERFLPNQKHLVCRFGPAIVAATFISSTVIQCLTPPQEDTAANAVLVHASNNNVSFPIHGMYFTYAAPPHVTSIWPLSGMQAGKTVVTVRGFHFTPYSVVCVWNRTAFVPAVVISSTLLRCTTPPTLPLGALTLQLTTNQQEMSTPVPFLVVPNIVLASITPSVGPALSGHTRVQVVGSGFQNQVELGCRFGAQIVPAKFVNATLIRCDAPSHAIGAVLFQVTSNGVDQALMNLSFAFLAEMEVRVITPLKALVTGQLPVFVNGVNFVNSSALACRFGDLVASATYVSPGFLVCIAPSRVGNLLAPLGLVPFDVTNNGVDYTASGILFEYIDACPPTRFCPKHDIVPVPNGTSVANDGRNFSLCPPTTFQPRAGQPVCLPCPVGFFCPDFGLSKPILCRAGFVCDRQGLRSPESMCPAGHYCLPGTKTLNLADYQSRPEYATNTETGITTFLVSSRPWSYIPRVAPATGSRRIEHPPDWVDPLCRVRQCASSTMLLLPERPFVCPLGMYCRSGASTSVPLPKNFSSPQPCFPGFFCPRGSTTPEGQGPCPTGYYCPTTTDAIPCPCGTYCPGVGNLKPLNCYPGTYQPQSTQSACVLCPVGSICPSYNTTVPTLCPEGFVCASLGLSVPVVMCPSGFFCSTGTWTSDPSALTPRRPFPCSTGSFCLGGVQHDLVIDWLPVAPDGATATQTCTEGAFCPPGTVASTLCYPGHYCPPGTQWPLDVPRGTFAQFEGSIAPTACFPGTFSTFVASTQCRVCPAGYTCPGYGVYIPAICPAGTYRSIADSVTCKLCPEGTWSPDTGVADLSYCQPCPAGRVCGFQGMNNLTQSIFCPSGYICGEATTRDMQYFHLCPAGYFCGIETTQNDQYAHDCGDGNVCYRGTKNTEATRFNCPEGSFCPRGTSDSSVKEVQCPIGTTSLAVSNELTDCSILPVAICDKDADTSYYPVFTYEFQGEPRHYNSLTSIGRTGEIQVLKKILPVNLSASAAPWVNNTLDVVRACPNVVPSTGGTLVTVIGRNFLPTHRLTCEFQVLGGDLVFESVPATYVNTTRVTCRTPPFGFDQSGATEADVVVFVTNYGIHRSATAAEIKYSSHPIILFMECGYNDAEEGIRPSEHGWFPLRAFSQAFLSFDFRALPPDMVFDEHFKLGLYVSPSACQNEQCDARGNLMPLGKDTEHSPCKQPYALPSWITSTAFNQHEIINLTVFALEDMIIKPEVHITYGLFLAAEDFFVNTTQVDITSPTRANVTEGLVANTRPLAPVISFEEELVPREYIFVAIYLNAYSLVTSYPLNLPPRFDQFERGRVLLMANVSEESEQPNIMDPPPTLPLNYWKMPYDTLDTTIDTIKKYRETFQGLSSDESAYAMNQVILPYMPFFSHCLTYDSYIPIWDLFENPACDLPGYDVEDRNWWRRAWPAIPNQDDIRPVGPLDILDTPVADYCIREIKCNYEEDLSTVDVNTRWYEAKDGAHLFDLMEEPITFADYAKGGALYNELLDAANSDIFVPVTVNREAAAEIEGGCLLQCYPRKIKLVVDYFQVTKQVKRIIAAKLEFLEFDKDPTKTDYTLEVEYAPLDYVGLVVAFAFDLQVFLAIFVVMGLVATTLAAIFWVITRLTTRIREPPKLRYFSYLALLAPPPTIGIFLGSIPCFSVVGIFYLFLNGDVVKHHTTFGSNPWSPWGDDFWFTDNIKSHYMALELDPTMVATMRHGRTGLCFFLMGMYLLYHGTMIFIPKTISISERAAEEKNDDEETTWHPTPWRRANVIFTMLLVSLFLVVVIEYSFWVDFGPHLIYTQFSYELVIPTLVVVMNNAVGDSLLIAPMLCTINVIFATIIMAAPDFLGFLIATFTAFGLLLIRRVYKKPTFWATVHFLKQVVAAAKFAGKATAKLIKFYVGKKPKKRPVKAEGDAADEEDESKKKEEEEKKKKEEDEARKRKEEDEEATVEPLIDYAMDYTMETLSFFFQPIVILLLMIFREETTMSDNWNIKHQDLEYYCFFFALFIPFQLCADVFILHVIELFRGWKMYDYFVYCRYRFIQREQRWKGMEHNLDECIEEGLRHLDQMCFSSQYYFMCSIQTWGMICFILSVEIMLRSNYNMFGDPAAIYLVPFMLAVCVFVHNGCTYLAKRLELYKLRHENTAWHNQPDDDEGVPNWEELERIKGASHEAFLMNQRLTSETFRFKFLNYNRAWIVQQLPNILTPRTLRRARPYLITQFSKILSSLNTNVSDDDDDDDGKPRFGPVSLNAPSRDLIRLWLAKARRRLRLRQAVQPLINAARKVECESCLSRRQLQVEMVIPIEVMGDKFERSFPSDEFDVAEWKKYFAQHQKFKTLCLSCLAKQKIESRVPLGANGDGADDLEAAATLGFGAVYLNAASRALMLKWYRLGQDRVFGKTGKRRAVANVSDDDDEAATRGAAWANQPVRLNAASTAIALKWMVSARLNIKAKNQGKKIQPLEAAAKPKRKKPPTKDAMKAQRTKRK